MLLTIADVEAASNTTIESENESYYQWYIDAVSAYITEAYPYLVYAAAEDIYCDSGPYGSIRLPGLLTTHSVALLDRYTGNYTTLIVGDYTFDGIDEIYNLLPHQTYKLNVTYGSATTPDSVKYIATQLVLAGTGLDPDAIGGVREVSVGNVKETYGITGAPGGTPMVSLSSIQADVLASYRPKRTTWRV